MLVIRKSWIIWFKNGSGSSDSITINWGYFYVKISNYYNFWLIRHQIIFITLITVKSHRRGRYSVLQCQIAKPRPWPKYSPLGWDFFLHMDAHDRFYSSINTTYFYTFGVFTSCKLEEKHPIRALLPVWAVYVLSVGNSAHFCTHKTPKCFTDAWYHQV